MKFAGQLEIAAEADSSVPVRIDLHEGLLSIVTDSSEIGTWPLESVAASQTGSSRFQLEIDGELAEFIADDPVEFSREGMRLINGPADSGVVSRLWSYLTEPDDVVSGSGEAASAGRAAVSVLDPATGPGVLIDLGQADEHRQPTWEFSTEGLEALYLACGHTLNEVRTGALRPEVGIAVARLATAMCVTVELGGSVGQGPDVKRSTTA